MKKWIILDCDQLCHRALHTTGFLRDPAMGATGVLYGFFGALLDFERMFSTDQIVFAFDRGKSKRRLLSKRYKATRRRKRIEATPDEKVVYNELRMQLKKLRTEYLKEIGYTNIYSQLGYEADDMIAAAAHALQGQEVVIISSDKDMYQLLTDNVSIYSPTQKKTTTKKSFINEYGIKPSKWVKVKALAGCPTDEVIGISGVGEKTAIQWLNGTLNEKSVKFLSIMSQKDEVLKRNIPLVQLPFPGTKEVKPKKHGKLAGWKDVLGRLKIKSIDPEISYRERK